MELDTGNDIRDVYDMDEDYNLLSWDIPSIEMKLTLGDRFIADGKEQILTKMMYAEDGLGIYSMYPHLDDDFYTLVEFVGKITDGEITRVPLVPPKNITPWKSSIGQTT
jgi:hypothetical protein